MLGIVLNLTYIDWTSIASMATLGTLLFLLLNLKEARKLRKSSYRPLLYVPDTSYFIYKDSYGVPNLWIRKPDDESSGLPPIVYIDLLNVGLAAAVQIEIEWCFDRERLESDCIRLIDENETRIEYAYTSAGLQFFYTNDVPYKYGFNLLDKNMKQTLSVMPKESRQRTKIPQALVNYVSYFYSEQRRMTNVKRRVLEFELPILLNLSYDDIEHQKITSEFKVTMELTQYDPDTNEERLTGIAAFRFHRKAGR